MTLLSFILQYKFVLLFYLVIAIIIFINRKKFQVENKFILLYKTKYGVNIINKVADKYKEFIKILGYSAIGIGFVGMLVIVGFLIKGLYDIIFVPSAPATLSLVIPGVQIPGSPIFIPFWYGIIALFIVVMFHEFGHGIVARSHGIKVKSTGIVFFVPLIGAFVEPDEKQLVKHPTTTQNSIFAAGPFFNAILSAIVFLLLMLILNPVLNTMVYPDGVSFSSIQPGYAAEKYGLEKDVVYNRLNGLQVNSSDDIVNRLSCIKPNEQLSFRSSNKTIVLITGTSPTDKSKGYLGVAGIKTDFQIKNNAWWYQGLYDILYFFINLLEWVFTLSLGIGLANLLPLGPVDGGRMINIALIDIKGKEKGTRLWINITIITLVVLAILVFVPILKGIFFKA